MASQQAAEAVKDAHGPSIRALPGAFAVSVQRRSPKDFVIVVFVDQTHPLPERRTVDGVEILFRHEERLSI